LTDTLLHMAEQLLLANPTNLRADSARNRSQIVEVARRMVSEDGSLLSMNAIAHAAGVGVGTVYRHFPTIQVLLESLAADSFAKLVVEARQAVLEADASVALERIIRTGFDCQMEDPGLAAVLASPSFECADILDYSAELFSCIGAIITRARQANVLRPDITPDDIRRLLNGLAVAAKDLAPRKRAQYLDVLLLGLRPESTITSRSAA
jgi:AcrR family transcriptional regulator